MAKLKGTLRTCKKGHEYYKSSDCPVCPRCENERELQTEQSFMSVLAAPARRALVNNGISTLKELSEFSELEIIEFHGIGQGSIPKLKAALLSKGLKFKTHP